MSFKDFTQGGGQGPSANAPTPGPTTAPRMTSDDEAKELLVDYSSFSSMEPTLFRDGVVNQLMSVLIGKDKPNALLVGEAGVGKTRVVEELARLIAARDKRVPAQLAGSHIWELPLSNIVSGSSFVGQLEEKLDKVLDFAADPTNDVILFIDEIHQISGDSQTYGKIGQMLKPALARGEVRVIGATTLQEAQDLTHDPAFSRRFTRVIVDELTREQTVEILKNAWPGLCDHYNNAITISDDVFDVVARVADAYATAGQHRPDNAMTLIDRVCADSIVERANQLAKIDDKAVAAALRAQPLLVTEKAAVRCARKLMTGQTTQGKVDFAALDEALSEIIGQDEPIARIRRQLRLRELGLFPQTRPLTILCAGPSGVGKSAVARIISRQLTGQAPITLNMTEFLTSASMNRIVGSPAGYVGSDHHTELPFDSLESNPYQVVLLDEMEKGCREVQRFFMSAFDDGYCKTNQGKVIDFSKCVFFVTTNAGHTTGASRSAGFSQTSPSEAKADADKLSKWFDVELLNRFQLMLTFNEIDESTYETILRDKYDREVTRIKAERPRLALPDALDDDEVKRLVRKTYVRDFGARPAERCVRETIEEKALACAP